VVTVVTDGKIYHLLPPKKCAVTGNSGNTPFRVLPCYHRKHAK